MSETLREFASYHRATFCFPVFVLYNMYSMDNVYNLSQFRASLRTAFNDAEQGKEVLVERYGKLYKLVATKHTIEIPAPNLPREVVQEAVGNPRSGLESLEKNEFQGPLFRNKKKGKI